MKNSLLITTLLYCTSYAKEYKLTTYDYTRNGHSRIAWRVYEANGNSGQDENEVTVQSVHASRYKEGEFSIELQDGKKYCLRAYKGSGSEFGDPNGKNGVAVKTSNKSTTLAYIKVDGANDMDTECFETPSTSHSMCIYTNKAEEVDGHFNPIRTGHVAILYTDSQRNYYTYGFWPRGVKEMYGKDKPSDYKYFYCETITEKQLQKLKDEVKSLNKKYTFLWYNCASFASDTFKLVTGTDVDADDWLLGAETPNEIGSSIIKKNGGKNIPPDGLPFDMKNRSN